MALTRARVVVGPAKLRARIEAVVDEVMRRPRDHVRILGDVADMRMRIARERGPAAALDVKNRRGGLIDVEFVAQALTLVHGARHPGLRKPSTAAALEALATQGLLAADDAAALRRAFVLASAVQAVLRTAIDGAVDAERQPPALLAGLARAIGASSFAALEADLDAACAAAHVVYERVIPAPTADADPPAP
jgi:glutamate-ammonia-ligase adenylyltransferase